MHICLWSSKLFHAATRIAVGQQEAEAGPQRAAKVSDLREQRRDAPGPGLSALQHPAGAAQLLQRRAGHAERGGAAAALTHGAPRGSETQGEETRQRRCRPVQWCFYWEDEWRPLHLSCVNCCPELCAGGRCEFRPRYAVISRCWQVKRMHSLTSWPLNSFLPPWPLNSSFVSQYLQPQMLFFFFFRSTGIHTLNEDGELWLAYEGLKETNR